MSRTVVVLTDIAGRAARATGGAMALDLAGGVLAGAMDPDRVGVGMAVARPVSTVARGATVEATKPLPF